MAFRLGPLWIGGGLIVALGLVALFHTERAPEPTRTTSSPETPASSPPQDHPTGSEAPAPQAPMPTQATGGDDGPTITWKVPSGWQTVPNPNAMRLATYTVKDSGGGDPAEVAVSRAGGSTDANIERWHGQFTDADQARRAEKTVRGLPVTLVEMSGTYSSSMMPGAAAAPHAGWALVAAIVQTSGSSYFFKMTGPSSKVQAARASFDALVDSLSPR